ncbi:unnamed protein product [Effrenium voratum]|nr:unnamed protein product [Effrenium voratum]
MAERPRWRGTVVVLDRTKSKEEPALEVLSLGNGPRRLVFDMLLKFHKARDLRLEEVAYLAIDEADFLLTQGFQDLYEILDLVEQESRYKKNLRYSLITASITRPLWKIFQDDPRFRSLKVLESRALHKPQANCSHTMLLTKGRCKVRMLPGAPEQNRAERAARQALLERSSELLL